MLINVKYYKSLNSPTLISFEINDNTEIAQVKHFLSEKISEEIEILPMKFVGVQANQTISQYYAHIDGDQRETHFIAVNSELFNGKQKSIIEDFLLSDTNDAKLTSNEDIKEYIQFLSAFLPTDVKDSLLVRLADNINMFGETVKDTISDPTQRQSLQVHPYPWLAAGVSNIVVYTDLFDQIYVALVYNDRSDNRALDDPLRVAKIPHDLRIPEGYMHPKPCKGGEKGTTTLSFATKNAAEELILKQVPMQQAYRTAINRPNSATLQTDTSEFDKSLEDCSIRKLHEEIHLSVSKDDILFVDKYESNRRMSFLVNTYLVTPKRQCSLPPLVPDNLDIKATMWAKVSGLHIEYDQSFKILVDYYDEETNLFQVPIPIGYASLIGQAISKFRDEQIKACSMFDGSEMFSCRKNVESRVKQILTSKTLNLDQMSFIDLLGVSPEEHLQKKSAESSKGSQEITHLAQLGKYAFEYHSKIMTLTRTLTRCSLDTPLTAKQLKEILIEEPEIINRLSIRSVSLFPLVQSYKAFNNIATNQHPGKVFSR